MKLAIQEMIKTITVFDISTLKFVFLLPIKKNVFDAPFSSDCFFNFQEQNNNDLIYERKCATSYK